MWFMDSHVTVLLSRATNEAGLSITEHAMPHGFGPPLHVHRAEDEVFYVLEGVIRYRWGDTIGEARQGDLVHMPRGVPHGFRVTAAEGARCLITSNGGFEDMLRAGSRPAPSRSLPQAAVPTAAQQAELAAVCAAHGIDLLGPPID